MFVVKLENDFFSLKLGFWSQRVGDSIILDVFFLGEYKRAEA